jgi:DnaJ-domain-containing protein 1
MAWPASGRVAEVPFARVVGGLALRGLTGALRLEQDGRRYVTHWVDGVIADAESSSPEDTLGRVAVEAGLMDNAALGDSLRKMALHPTKSQRRILEESGALAGEALERAVRLTITRRALRTFALPGATFAVEESAPRKLEGSLVEPRWLLYRGLRLHYDERRLDEEMAALDGYAMRLVAGGAEVFDRFGFGDEERILVRYLEKGYWELPSLIEACMTVPRPIVTAVVHALHAFEALDVRPAVQVDRLYKPRRETTVQISRDVLKLPVTPPPVTVSFVPPQGARITPPADTPRPRAAGTDPPAGQPPSTRATQPVAPPAHSVPTLPVTPVADRARREQIAAKFAAVEANADHFAILEVAREASSEQIKAAYFQLAKTYHPDRLAIHKLDDLRPQVARIFARLSDAYAGIRDDAHRKEYLELLARGGDVAAKRHADDEAERAATLLTAEEHCRKGEMALRRQMWDAAVSEFGAALEMNDQEAEHHALLAWAKFCAAPVKEAIFTEVRAGLNRAVQLNHKCTKAFYYLGQVYNAVGDIDRAYGSFQKVLDLEESHVDARREVRVIEMRRKSDKKGLFGKKKK